MQLFFTILLWILGILLAVLLLLLICPVWVWLRLDYDKFSAKVQILGFKFTVYPLKEKPEKEKKEPVQQEPPKKKAVKKRSPSKRFQLTAEKIVGLIETAGGVMHRLLRALKIRNICVLIPLEGEDAADTALFYGKFSAWFYGGIALLQNFLDMKFESIELIPDFGGDNKYRRSFSCKIGTCPLIILGIAIYAFRMLRKEHIL